MDADFFCLQETKLQEGQIDFAPEGYYAYWNYAVKKGYSGTAIFARKKPVSVAYGIGILEHDQEGRVITLEYEDFYLVTCYTPNSQNELARLSYRMEWEDAFREYLLKLDEKKPVVMCGDLNVAHKEIDLKNPKTNRHNAGFTDEERGKFTELLEAGFTDSFRYFYPEETGIYSWWSYRFKAREKNAGWRIDYFCVSRRLEEKLVSGGIHTEVLGIALALAGEGREIRVAATLAQGRAALGEEEYALVLLDLNLPDGNGLDFLTALRRTSGVPVLILTANDLESDQVAGLELGADDYMTKPFSLAVLRARVNRLLRRGSAPAAALELGPFSFDFERLRFMRNGTEVELSKTEQRLLRLLVEHRGQTLTREQLLDRVWDGGEFVDANALSVAVKRLRDKLTDAPIKTVYGLGYTWEEKR